MNIYSPLDCVPANVQEADAASAANWAEMVKEDQVKLIRAWQQSPEWERERERERVQVCIHDVLHVSG